ncbi:MULTISPECIES: hypothetical protein [unclassified Corynebacterium]|uniref:hypothetical protein n=1 Tax=unclassified Corynebacterium TaxID=2624378 RepID=UPI000A3F53D0|nr:MULTISPECIES: hypothetical protein [unclassified Corynebacterium]
MTSRVEPLFDFPTVKGLHAARRCHRPRLPILWRVVLPAILGAIGLFFSSQAPAGSVGLYIAVTATMGIPPTARGIRTHRRHRRTRSPPRRQPHLLHLVWSIGMAYPLPLFID